MDKIPGLNAPMTGDQKWALAFMVVAAAMNLIAIYLLATGRLGL
jgi:hypothetical protein